MAQNPINNERVIRIESQALLWLAGLPLHNGQTDGLGECTLDFSCCNPDMLSSPDERIRLAVPRLAESLIEEIRSREPDYGEEVDVDQQELIVAWIRKWFSDLIYDTIGE